MKLIREGISGGERNANRRTARSPGFQALSIRNTVQKKGENAILGQVRQFPESRMQKPEGAQRDVEVH
jgi:hypothetical protein